MPQFGVIWFMFLKIVIVFENLDNTISIFYEICFCSLNFAFTFFFVFLGTKISEPKYVFLLSLF